MREDSSHVLAYVVCAHSTNLCDVRQLSSDAIVGIYICEAQNRLELDLALEPISNPTLKLTIGLYTAEAAATK